MRRRRTALPSATPRRRTTLPALLLAALATLVAVVAAPAAQAFTPSVAVSGSQGPKGASTGSASAATPGTTHRTARSSGRSTAGAVAGPVAPRTSHVAPSAGTGPDGAHQLLPQPALPPHVAAPAPPVTPLRHTAVAVPPPAGRPLVVSPGRSPPADPRRA